MSSSKPFQTEFGIHDRLESCVRYRKVANTSKALYPNIRPSDREKNISDYDRVQLCIGMIFIVAKLDQCLGWALDTIFITKDAAQFLGYIKLTHDNKMWSSFC